MVNPPFTAERKLESFILFCDVLEREDCFSVIFKFLVTRIVGELDYSTPFLIVSVGLVSAAVLTVTIFLHYIVGDYSVFFDYSYGVLGFISEVSFV